MAGRLLVGVLLCSTLASAEEATERSIDWKLFEAVQYHYDVKPLLEQGANPDAPAKHWVNGIIPGETPYLHALDRAEPAVIDQLRAARKSDTPPSPSFQARLFVNAMNTTSSRDPNYSNSRILVLLHYGLDLNALPTERLGNGVSMADGMTPLMYASARGLAATVQLLLSRGAKPNLQNQEGKTALSYAATPQVEALLLAAGATPSGPPRQFLVEAAKDGNLERARDVLKSGKAVSGELDAALLVASSNRRPELVKLLLDAGAKPNVRADARGEWTPLLRAVASNDVKSAKVLLEAGADPRLGKDERQHNALVLSVTAADPELFSTLWPRFQPLDDATRAKVLEAAKGARPEVLKQLGTLGLKVGSDRVNGVLALGEAVERNDVEGVRLLLAQGADPNGGPRGARTTPLRRAVQAKALDSVELLLKAGARPDGDGGDTSLVRLAAEDLNLELFVLLQRYGASLKSPKPEENPLHGLHSFPGARVLSVDERARLLAILDRVLKAGNRIDAPDEYGQTLLWRVVRGDTELVRAVVARKANVNALAALCRRRTRKGRAAASSHFNGIPAGLCRTPLMAALEADALQNVKVLVAAGANVNLASPADGYTPLMAAAVIGNAETVAFLLGRGAKPSARDDHGLTAADYARRQGNDRALALLEKATAPKGAQP